MESFEDLRSGRRSTDTEGRNARLQDRALLMVGKIIWV